MTSIPLKSDVYAPGFASDPTVGAGVAAPIGSVLPQLGTNRLWQKTSAPDTGWTLQLPMGFGNVLRVDKIYGDDALGARSGAPYATLAAAIAAALPGDLILLYPGAHTVTPFTIPTGVSIQGVDVAVCSIDALNVVADTDLVTMSNDSSIGLMTIRLTSAEHHTLRAVSFPGITAETAVLRDSVVIVDNSTAAIGGVSNVSAIHSSGLSVLVQGVDAVVSTVVQVNSIGGGQKRGVVVDTAAQQFSCHNVNITLTSAGGAGVYYGVETNFAGATCFLHASQISAPTADISQTLGTISLDSTTLVNSTANGLGFTAVIYPSSMVYADSGPTAGGVTRFMRPGTATVAISEIKQRVSQQCLAFKMSVRALVGPGAARVDTFTVRKNGIDTALTVSLTGAQVANSDVVNSVSFAQGDDISVKIVTAIGSTLEDVILTIELY